MNKINLMINPEGNPKIKISIDVLENNHKVLKEQFLHGIKRIVKSHANKSELTEYQYRSGVDNSDNREIVIKGPTFHVDNVKLANDITKYLDINSLIMNYFITTLNDNTFDDTMYVKLKG